MLRLEELAKDSIDACVTDPPYGIGFAGNEWDHNVPGTEFWNRVLDVLKPGACLMAFGGTRSWHRTTCAIEDSGFEIRDTLMWIYANGYPHQGCLKPSWEPIVVARKPLSEATLVENIARHGCGNLGTERISEPEERRPSNLWHDSSPEVEQAFEIFGSRKSCSSPSSVQSKGGIIGGKRTQGRIYPGEIGSASRFFFSPKANAEDRAGSNHPTIKPQALMRYLVRLATPANGIVLDPFAGSGSTGQAAALEGLKAVLVEKSLIYCSDIVKRFLLLPLISFEAI